MEAGETLAQFTDNRAENLAWGSQADNLEDQRRHGTCVWKLDPEKAREIRSKKKEGASTAELAREYGVRRHAIWAVVAGRTYKEA